MDRSGQNQLGRLVAEGRDSIPMPAAELYISLVKEVKIDNPIENCSNIASCKALSRAARVYLGRLDGRKERKREYSIGGAAVAVKEAMPSRSRKQVRPSLGGQSTPARTLGVAPRFCARAHYRSFGAANGAPGPDRR